MSEKEKDHTITEKIDQRTPHIRCSLPNPRTGEQCNEIMILDPASKDFWRCPLCGATTWPDERRQMELDERARAEEYERRQMEIQKGRVTHDFFFLDHKSTMPVGGTLIPQVDMSKGGGGGKSGRKKRKKPVKRGAVGGGGSGPAERYTGPAERYTGPTYPADQSQNRPFKP